VLKRHRAASLDTTRNILEPLLTSGFGVRVPGGVLGDIDAHQRILEI
jgi:hypothetical protein